MVVAAALASDTLSLEDWQTLTSSIGNLPTVALSLLSNNTVLLNFSEESLTMQATLPSAMDLVIKVDGLTLDSNSSNPPVLAQISPTAFVLDLNLAPVAVGGEALIIEAPSNTFFGLTSGLVQEAILTTALHDLVRPAFAASIVGQTEIDSGSRFPLNSIILAFSEAVLRPVAPNDTVAQWDLMSLFNFTTEGGVIAVQQAWLVDSQAEASRRALRGQAAESLLHGRQLQTDAQTVLLVVQLDLDPYPAGDGSEVVVITPYLNALADAAGNSLPTDPRQAGALSAITSSSSAGVATVESASTVVVELFSDCETNTTMDLGKLMPPLVALVHGLLHTAGPLLPYASEAMHLRAEQTLTMAGKTRRATPKWGPCVWFISLVFAMTTLTQVALDTIRIPWAAALAPLWFLEAAALFWLVHLAPTGKRAARRVEEAGTKGARTAFARWLAVLQMLLDIALHLAVVLITDLDSASAIVVLAVAVPQLFISLGVAKHESQLRSVNAVAPRRAQLLQLCGEALNWLLVGAMIALVVLDPDWQLRCVGSWLWALAPFWLSALLLLLHQLYLCCLWRGLRPRKLPQPEPVKHTAQDFEGGLKMAIGFAIREQVAHGSAVDEAVTLIKAQLDDARANGTPLTEAAMKLHGHGLPPPAWVALGQAFMEATGRPPVTEAELVAFGKSLLLETKSMGRKLNEACSRFGEAAVADFAPNSVGPLNNSAKADLLKHVRGMRESARAGGITALREPIKLALKREFSSIYGRPAGGDEELLELLDRLVDGMATPKDLVEVLPPRLEEAFHLQLVALNRAGNCGLGEHEESLLLLDTLLRNTGGAAAAVVCLQDQAQKDPSQALPMSVKVAIADEFARQKGHAPSDTETVMFMKEILVGGARTSTVSPQLMSAACDAYASAHGGAAPLDVFSALHALQLTLDGDHNPAITKKMVQDAVATEKLQSLTQGPNLLPPVLELAMQAEFTTRFGGEAPPATELTRFAKSMITDFDSRSTRDTMTLSEEPPSPQKTGSGSTAFTAAMSCKALPLSAPPGRLTKMPTRLSFTSAFDTTLAEKTVDVEEVTKDKQQSSDRSGENVGVDRRRSMTLVDPQDQAREREAMNLKSQQNRSIFARAKAKIILPPTLQRQSSKLEKMGQSAKRLITEMADDIAGDSQNLVKFGAKLDGNVEDFDPLEAKKALIKQLGLDVSPKDISFEVRQGSIIISATIRTPDLSTASATKAGVSEMLLDREHCARVFDFPLKSICQPPTVEKEHEDTGPLRGSKLNQAIMSVLAEGPDGLAPPIIDEETFEEEAKEQPKGTRRASYALFICLPLVAIGVVAAIFGDGGELTQTSMTALALGGMTSIVLVALGIAMWTRRRVTNRTRLVTMKNIMKNRIRADQSSRRLSGLSDRLSDSPVAKKSVFPLDNSSTQKG